MSETDGRRSDIAMNLRRRENHSALLHCLGWTARSFPLRLPVAGEAFLLTSPFIERAYRTSTPRARLPGQETPSPAVPILSTGRVSGAEVECKNGRFRLRTIRCLEMLKLTTTQEAVAALHRNIELPTRQQKSNQGSNCIDRRAQTRWPV